MLNDNNSNFHNLFFNGYDLMLLSNGLRRYNTPCRRYLPHYIIIIIILGARAANNHGNHSLSAE